MKTYDNTDPTLSFRTVVHTLMLVFYIQLTEYYREGEEFFSLWPKDPTDFFCFIPFNADLMFLLCSIRLLDCFIDHYR